jgi:flagellar hook-basal body complex protein FliE
VSVAPIAYLAPVTGAVPTQGAAAAQPGSAVAFADLLTREVGEVNQQLLTSQADLQGLALGGSQNLHEVMIRLEQTRIAFQLMVQVRNRLLEAYQDVMRMQI